MGNALRLCTLCDQPYQPGGYAAHAALHRPVRKRSLPRRVSPARERAIELLEQGSYTHSEIAQVVGLSRQRIGQIAKDVAA